MSISSNDPMNGINDLFGEINVPSPTPSLLDTLQDFNPNEDFPSPPKLLPDSNDLSSSGFSPELHGSFTSEDASATISQVAAFPPEMQTPFLPEFLTIIVQPCCSSKARYRKDYLPPSTRRDALTNKNPDSNYKGPAISIPSTYLDITKQYYIGVSLVTLFHEKTNCRYIHPYELESIDYKERNDPSNNIVWFPIGHEDRNGFKSFLDLRVVRKTESELENYGSLRRFPDCNSNILKTVVLSKRQIVPEYNLKKAQLAFFLGQKINGNEEFPTIVDSCLTILSEEIILIPDQEAVEGNESTESTAKSSPPPPPECRMYKYAPRYGFAEGNEEILIFYNKKLDEKKYGQLQIKFESDTLDIQWSAEVDPANIEVKDQMVSFRTPSFLSSVNTPIGVKIILQQRERILQPLQYFYMQKSQCFTCQANVVNPPSAMTRTNSNKRTKSRLNTSDDETDALTHMFESTLAFRQSKSEPESNSSNSTSRSSINTNQANSDEGPILKKLRESIELLFTYNDFKPVLRICRPFIRKRPELLHQAISKNDSELISNFISVAGIELLQQRNHLGETVLLHAARLHRIDIVRATLEREQSNKLLESTNDKGQNIFHILALNANSDDIVHLFIDHLLKNSINIAQMFDHADEDNHTPLQLAILNNNLLATRHLLKYFNKNVCETTKHIGENLIHLVVRCGDLTMLKYLLDQEHLMEQGNQTSLTMTPIELARSLKRQDMLEYLEDIYPQPEIDKEETSCND